MSATPLYAGLMSGTSLDGVDAVLADFSGDTPALRSTSFFPYPSALKDELLALNSPGDNEIDRAARAANLVTRLYADAIAAALKNAGIGSSEVAAIGCHGQTIRHRPDAGYTVQLCNAALLTELCGITVIADFRSRDIAAAGEGAPLVPGFHAACFSAPRSHRVIVNLGGIANLTDLPAGGEASGFDTGPGNLLMDLWARRHIGLDCDEDGAWAATGRAEPLLLEAMLADDFFRRPPPKSTGRDKFNLGWIEAHDAARYAPENVQATLLALTAVTVTEAIARHCKAAAEVYACGGGTANGSLMRALAQRLEPRSLATTAPLGIHPDWVEAAAFAWLAERTLAGEPGNLPAVTGARGPRVLGAIYRK